VKPGLLGCVLWLATVPVLAACPPGASDGQLLTSPALTLAWQLDAAPAQIAVGRHFALRLQLCPTSARLLRVDASMPEHRHGMNYRPSLTPLGEGRWLAEGLLFHMAGRWELRFDVESAGRTEVLRQSMVLP